MKIRELSGLCPVLCLSAFVLQAQAQVQETDQIGQLQKQLKQTQERFERQQREMKEEFERVIRTQQAQIDSLTKQITHAPAPAATGASPIQPVPATAVTPEEVKELSGKVDQVVEAQKKIRPGEFNPSIGLVGETVFSYRTRGPGQTGADRAGGFDVHQRSLELNLAASVDPFAKAYVVVNAAADSATGEATLGVEEAAFQTTSLPGNLELKAGRFFGEFGRLGYIHDHELPFVNRPLALDQYLGGESQSDGLQLNWLLPIPHFVSLTLGVGDHFGDPKNNPGDRRAFTELNFWGRLSTYLELTPDWQIEAGISGLWNPKTEDRGGAQGQPDGGTLTERERRVAGLDLKVSYVPLRDNQFRSLTWGTELLCSDNRYLFDPNGSLAPSHPSPGLDGDEFSGRIGSFGVYSYVTYKWSRQWSGGFLFDWVQNAQDHHDETFAYSPYLTLALSHWNQVRLQYTHTGHNPVSGLRSDDAIYLQWAWIIGSHSHGWQQR